MNKNWLHIRSPSPSSKMIRNKRNLGCCPCKWHQRRLDGVQIGYRDLGRPKILCYRNENRTQNSSNKRNKDDIYHTNAYAAPANWSLTFLKTFVNINTFMQNCNSSAHIAFLHFCTHLLRTKHQLLQSFLQFSCYLSITIVKLLLPHPHPPRPADFVISFYNMQLSYVLIWALLINPNPEAG